MSGAERVAVPDGHRLTAPCREERDPGVRRPDHITETMGIKWGRLATLPIGSRSGLRVCSPDWTRTNNPAINSRMLCQLSYGG